MPFTRSRPAGVLPVLTPTFVDAFTRANEALEASTNWSLRSGTANVDTDQVKATSGALVAACNTALGPDQKVTLAASAGWSVCCRMGATGTDRYEFGYDFNRFKLRKYVGGTLIATAQDIVAPPPTAPFTIELEVAAYGTEALCMGRVNGVLNTLYTDASGTALGGGLGGIRCSISGAVADDFNAYGL